MNSKIILAKNIKMDRQYTNVLSYSESQILTLVTSSAHKVAEANNYSFLRPTGSIMAGFTYEQCLQSNYIAFQNPDYSNKWFFAWIDDVIYKGDKNTEIRFTIDAWSTWFDYWTKKACFITRQHVNNDTIGANTIPENLDVGEVIQESETYDASYDSSSGYYVVIQSAWKIKDGSDGWELLETDKGTQHAGISVYDKNVFGTQLFLFPITNLSSFVNVSNFLQRTTADKHIEDVENIFIVPNALITAASLESHSAYCLSQDLPFTFYTLSYDMTPSTFNTTITKRTSFSDYTPKNNKCFVYPYNYLFVTNNNGSNNIFKYEDFTSTNCVFENQLSMSIGCSGRIVPKNYKGMTNAEDEALALGKYPTCAWSSDAFTNWLSQNAVNIAVSVAMIAGSIATAGAGAAAAGAASAAVAEGATISAGTAGAVGTGVSVAGSIGNTIGGFYQAALLPNIKGGQATGDVVFATDSNKFVFREMRAKTEYMRIIDSYFSRFGYAIRNVEIPNITGRTYWNYIEIGSSEEIGYGDVPSKFMDIINNSCRRGVTIWHSHENLGNYSLNNTIIT